MSMRVWGLGFGFQYFCKGLGFSEYRFQGFCAIGFVKVLCRFRVL